MALYHGHTQDDSLVSVLPPEILFEICRYILPTTSMLAKMTEISAKAFRQQFASLHKADISLPAKQLDQALATALSAQTLTAKADHIQMLIQDYLQKENDTHVNKKLVASPTVALLCKYHLLAGHKIPSVALPPKQQSDAPDGQPPQKKRRL